MMDLRTKLGQMICMGFNGPYPSQEFYDLVRNYKVGNVTLFRHNIESKEQIAQVLAEIRTAVVEATGYPPFISVDQEGGMVTRFSPDFTHFPGAMAVAATGKPELAREIGRCTGLEMKAVGANFNLAPCVDINTNGANPVIGVRAYGDRVEQVESFAFAMMEGLEAAGVAPMIKHFPGHGNTHQDSHFSLPVVDKSLEELMNCELRPYMDAIRMGVPSIMTSHIVFPQLDESGLPATMSRAIMTDLLRGKLGFQGIIRSDDLEMDAIKKFYGVVEGAVMALKAGVDIISISHSPALVAEFVERVEALVLAGELDAAIIDQAFMRMTQGKARYAEASAIDLTVPGCRNHRELACSISEQSITLVRDDRGQLPLKPGKTLVVGTYAFNQTNVNNPLLLELNFANILGKALDAQPITIANSPTPEQVEEVLAAAKGADTVVFGSYNAHLVPAQAQLANTLAAQHANVIFATMRNPYDAWVLSDSCAQVACYEYTDVSLRTNRYHAGQAELGDCHEASLSGHCRRRGLPRAVLQLSCMRPAACRRRPCPVPHPLPDAH